MVIERGFCLPFWVGLGGPVTIIHTGASKVWLDPEPERPRGFRR
jgi:hypothetical protein